MKDIQIGNKTVGKNHPCYIIAEVGSNFDGSLDRAKKLVDDAIACGADAVKFQSFKASKIVSSKGFDGLKSAFQAKWDKPVVEVYKKAEFPREWHKILFDYCKSKGVEFLSAPYDFEAVDLLDELGVQAFKIGSGDLNWHEMLEYIAKKNKPIILATGSSTFEEVKEAIDVIKKHNDKIILLQCVTNYPSHFESANINTMKAMGKEFDVLYGYSDHTPGSVVPLGSVALGGKLLEKHFTDDKTRYGPDHVFAMDIDDFKQMCTQVRQLEEAMGSYHKRLYEEEKETVILQRRCLRVTRDISEGTIFEEDMIEVLRPAPLDGLAPKYKKVLVGSKCKKSLKEGEHITREHF